MNVRNFVATALGFGVAAVVLAVLVAVVGTADVALALGRANVHGVALVGAAIVGWICLWGAALRVILAAVGADVSTVDAILVNASVSFANHVTPFGQAGGEPVAAWLVSDVSDVGFDRSLAAMTSFDTVNVVPSVSFALAGLAYYATATAGGPRFPVLVAGVGILAVGLPVVGVVAWRRRRAVERGLVGAVAGPLAVAGRVLPRVAAPDRAVVRERVGDFVGGIERIAGDRRRVALAVVLSAAGWALQAFGLWIAVRTLGASVPLYVPFFVVPLGTVASALPTPGGLGGIETVQVTLLTAATSVPAATATAAVAIFSVGGFFLTTSIGGAAMAALLVREGSVGRFEL